jgi:hypothetical protein
MTYTINKKPSKSGIRPVFFITINGKRVSGTNYGRKWEAIEDFKKLVEKIGEAKVLEWANK